MLMQAVKILSVVLCFAVESNCYAARLGLLIPGIVVSSVGAIALVAGAASKTDCEEDPESYDSQSDCTSSKKKSKNLAMSVGFIGIAVGIPLIAFGAEGDSSEKNAFEYKTGLFLTSGSKAEPALVLNSRF
jgi:hypothetical protein